MTVLDIQPYVQLFAYLAAGIFFAYKLFAGYFMTNLSITLTTARQHSTREQDHLVVSVELAKGDRGTVQLHDCQVKISWNDKAVIRPLIGADRRSKNIEHFDRSKRSVVNWDARSVTQPFLHLTAGETANFATYSAVPANAICEVEVAILAMKRTGVRVCQWRASAISLPLNDNQPHPAAVN